MEKTIPLHVFDLNWLAVPLTGPRQVKPSLDPNLWAGQLQSANERFAQVGIKFVNNTIQVVDPPGGPGSLANGLPYVKNQGFPEAVQIMNALGTPQTTDLCVFYVPYLGVFFGNNLGTSYSAKDNNTGKTANNCFVPGQDPSPFTLAHELGHIIGYFGHDKDTSWHLMRGGGTSGGNVYNGSKRFTQDQGKTIQQTNPNGLIFYPPSP